MATEVHEVRYVPGKLMIADCLTKKTKSGENLMNILRTGAYSIPGGANLRDSTLLAVKTWAQLMQAEETSEAGKPSNESQL